jgi:hypothetical protein
MMNDDYEDMNCCSEYFYIRYANENTLIGKRLIYFLIKATDKYFCEFFGHQMISKELLRNKMTKKFPPLYFIRSVNVKLFLS